MEIIKTIFEAVLAWIWDFIWFLGDGIDYIVPESLKGIGPLIVIFSYVITIFTTWVLAIKFVEKKKYRTSSYFFIICFLMIGYIIAWIINIGNNGLK